MENLLGNEKSFDETIDARRLIGARVISKNGYVFGRIAKIRINSKNVGIEGVVINRGIFRGQTYIGRTYFGRITENSIILNIQPTVLMKGKKVVSSEGKVLGKVINVIRSQDSNAVKEIIVKKLFSKEFSIPSSYIEFFNKSVMLKKSYKESSK